MARFDEGRLPLDGGLLALRTVHPLSGIIGFRMLAIAAGYGTATTPAACVAIQILKWP